MKGATLLLNFAACVAPFLIIVFTQGKHDVLYYRVNNQQNLRVNLPVHTGVIELVLVDAPKLEHIMTLPLKKPTIPYKFNRELVKDRGYPISQIRRYKVQRLPGVTPACFFFYRGVMLEDAARMAAMPQQIRSFVRGHELGHYYYDDEQEADRFSVYNYINAGYNFSSALNSLTDFLTPNGINANRMLAVHGEICKMHNLIDD